MNATGYMKVIAPAGNNNPWYFFPFSDRMSQDKAYIAAHNLASRKSGRVVTWGEVAAPYAHLERVGQGIGEWTGEGEGEETAEAEAC